MKILSTSWYKAAKSLHPVMDEWYTTPLPQITVTFPVFMLYYTACSAEA